MSTPKVTEAELARGLAVLERELGLEKAKAFLVAVSDRRVMAGAESLLAKVLGSVAKDPQKAVVAGAVAAGGLLAFQALTTQKTRQAPAAFPTVFKDEPAEVTAEVVSVNDVNLDKLVHYLGPGDDS